MGQPQLSLSKTESLSVPPSVEDKLHCCTYLEKSTISRRNHTYWLACNRMAAWHFQGRRLMQQTVVPPKPNQRMQINARMVIRPSTQLR